ncbi:MAG TPA: hypothetical protein VG943_01120 [Caulobacterales bacterium]|nr:hypothetical protein [Caulobacterales bacterium]
MRGIVLTLAVLLAPAVATAQDSALPTACVADAQGAINYQACADATPVGSTPHMLALINLGTEAFLRADYATAVRFYDQAQPADGQQVFSDPRFHAFRGSSYFQVGRKREALEDAHTVLTMLGVEDASETPDIDVIYAAILPILNDAHDPAFTPTLNAYKALPAADWVSYVNQAGLLEQLHDIDGALAADTRAFALQPDNPVVLNTHCYILTRAGRAQEALPFCERAVAAAPSVAPVHHSYASALAALGQCDRANAELAQARRLDSASLEYRRPLTCRAR